MIQNPLNDIVPAKYRKLVYALLSLGALVFAAFQAAQGDWAEFVGALFTTLVGTTAASNTNTQPDYLNPDSSPVAEHAEDSDFADEPLEDGLFETHP